MTGVDGGALLDALVTIALFLLAQTGAFLWWAATINQGQKDHGYCIEQVEKQASKTSNDVAYMKGQKGMEI